MDYNLAFPYDAWLKSACPDAMLCKIGQRLFVKCIQLFLLDNKLIEVGDRDKLYAEIEEFV